MTYAGQLDGMVLQIICNEPGPWDREELLREFDSRVHASDALRRLIARGLVLEVLVRQQDMQFVKMLKTLGHRELVLGAACDVKKCAGISHDSVHSEILKAPESPLRL